MHPLSRFVVTALLSIASSVVSAGQRVAVVRANTYERIVAAMLQANSSGRETIIRVAPGTYLLTQRFGEPGSESGLPVVTGQIAIEGRGVASTVFKGSGTFDETASRLFTVAAGGRLLLSGATLESGIARCPDEPCRERGGGAVLNQAGTVWIEDCELHNNISSDFAGGNNVTYGGAILSLRGHLHVENSTIDGNRAGKAGGGIAVVGGSATLLRSNVRSNRSGAGIRAQYIYGAGLYVEDASVWITGSTISGNSSGNVFEYWVGFGAGIFNNGGRVWMKNSAVVENRVFPYGGGGGINNMGTMEIENSTVSGNSAGTRGGGILNLRTLTLRGITVAGNEVLGNSGHGQGGQPVYPAGCDIDPESQKFCVANGAGIWTDASAITQIANSVVANNLRGIVNSTEQAPADCAGKLVSFGRNAIGNTVDCAIDRRGDTSWFGENLTNLDVRLGALQDDGEAGHAHMAPLDNSPLIDQGGRVPDRCAQRDQLGQRRNDGDADGKIRCDIGSVEFVGP